VDSEADVHALWSFLEGLTQLYLGPARGEREAIHPDTGGCAQEDARLRALSELRPQGPPSRR
jgi:hypothetical protein